MLSGARFGIPLEKRGDFFLFHFALRHLAHHALEFQLARGKDPAVYSEKDKRSHRPHPFVPVNEGMVLNQVKKISGGHFKEVGVKVGVTKAGLRHGNRGFQKAYIANAGAPPIQLNHLAMDFENLIECQKEGSHWSIGESLEHFAVFAISFLKRRTESFLCVQVSNRGYDEAFSVGRYGERGIGINIKDIQDTAIDDEGEAIAVLGKTFDHKSVAPLTLPS